MEAEYSCSGIAKNAPFDSEVFTNLAGDWFCFHSNRFILLFDLDSFAFWLGGSINSRKGGANINRGRVLGATDD